MTKNETNYCKILETIKAHDFERFKKNWTKIKHDLLSHEIIYLILDMISEDQKEMILETIKDSLDLIGQDIDFKQVVLPRIFDKYPKIGDDLIIKKKIKLDFKTQCIVCLYMKESGFTRLCKSIDLDNDLNLASSFLVSLKKLGQFEKLKILINSINSVKTLESLKKYQVGPDQLNKRIKK